MERQEGNRVIHGEVTIPGPIEKVFDAWTTEKGITSFFGPAANVELRVNGPYEVLFNLSAPPGERGAEGMRILAFQRPVMLSFTWNSPPHLATVRGQMTHVVIRFESLDSDSTRVTLCQDGWGIGSEWDQAYEYFQVAWLKIVLPRLLESFTTGPIDWSTFSDD
jgi:uncharacterized protein YndB with AHSA1/START domain